MKSDNEAILEAWLRLSLAVNNSKLVSDMPFNEARICNILYNNQMCNPERKLTATDLCKETRILKSQMNRTLNHMEAQGIIKRSRSTSDRRQIWITLNAEHSRLYKLQHEKTLHFIDSIAEKIGRDKSNEIIQLFTLIADTAEEVLS